MNNINNLSNLQKTSKTIFLIFGGGGFIGSNLAIQLAKEKQLVFLIDKKFDKYDFLIKNLEKSKDNAEDNTKELQKIQKNIQKIYNNFAFTKSKEMNGLLQFLKEKQFNLVILNLTATLGPQNVLNSTHYLEYELQTFNGILTILNILKNQNKILNYYYFTTSETNGDQNYLQEDESPRIIQSIESSVYQRQKYSVSKIFFNYYFKEFCKNNNINYYEIIPFNVVGSNQDLSFENFVIPKLINDIFKGKITLYGNSEETIGNQERNFIHVEDFSRILTKLIKVHLLDFNIRLNIDKKEIFYFKELNQNLKEPKKLQSFNIANIANTIKIKKLLSLILMILSEEIKIIINNIENLELKLKLKKILFSKNSILSLDERRKKKLEKLFLSPDNEKLYQEIYDIIYNPKLEKIIDPSLTGESKRIPKLKRINFLLKEKPRITLKEIIKEIIYVYLRQA